MNTNKNPPFYTRELWQNRTVGQSREYDAGEFYRGIMCKALILMALFSMISSTAWSSCDDVYVKRVDYLSGTETIAVQVVFAKSSDPSAVKAIETLAPQFYQTVASQIPKYSSVKVVNYSGVPEGNEQDKNVNPSNTTIFKFVIDTKQPMPNIALFKSNITLYLTKPGSSKDIAHNESSDILLDNSEQENFLSELKPLTQETIETVVCLKDKVCPTPQPCNDRLQIQRKKSNSEDDILQRMKELEEKK